MEKRLYCLFVGLLLTSALTAAERVPWSTSTVVGSPDPPKPYHVQRVYPELEFDQPVELMPLADTGKMAILEVNGKLFTFDDQPECANAKVALDVAPLFEEFHRAFGFGVHPNFADNRQVFVAYAGKPLNRSDGTRLSRFVMSDDFTIDPSSEEILLTWHSGGHNGCAIRFDSNGLLYFSLGDGARPFPPDEYDVSQDLSDLRATICRIDVDQRDGDKPYSIPNDNPFVDTPGARPEIWAYGFRNPWRFTIVPETDQLFCGDVGWELWELVFDVRRGGNYGWSIFEGPQPIRGDIKQGPTPINKPLVAYPHAVGQSVTGGVVYRGDELPGLQGAYLYGDYVTGLLWGLRHEEEQVTWNPVLAETGVAIITIAESRDKEVLVVGYDGGIYQLAENEIADQPIQFPRRLSETGLFDSTRSLTPAPGVVPYEIASHSWQDGATSTFVIGIPGPDPIKINQRQRSWKYPSGTVLAKTIEKDSRRIETQVLHFNGIDWNPYSYVWNDDQTDADLVDAEGIEKEIAIGDESASTMTWQIQNRAQCRACHSRQHGGAVGFSLANLGKAQSERFVEMGILDRPAPKQWNVSEMVDPADESAALTTRARSYLTANCAHCHQRGGGGTVPLDMTFSNPRDQINAVDVIPTQGLFGIDDARVIAPGDPYRSALFYRMATSGTGHMPKIWKRQNDVEGLKLVHDWIVSLGAENPERISATTKQGTSAALLSFSHLLFDDDVAPDTRLAVARDAVAGGDVVTSALFERFLPVEERTKRLGENINAKSILEIEGNALRGREWFFNAQSGQCVQCHRLQGSGKSIGADLDAIGKKRTREQLLDSILDPSKEIEPKYSSYLVLTVDGVVVTGLKTDENNELLVIRAADGNDHRILKESIESFKVQSQSLMPAGLAATMTAQELADLLEFLCSLK